MTQAHSQGFTLLEILISLFLLSFILLSFNAIQLYSLQKTYSLYDFHVATEQLNSIIEQLHPHHNTGLTSEQMDHWNSQNSQLLPNGNGEVVGHYPSYTITVYWGKSFIQRNITL